MKRRNADWYVCVSALVAAIPTGSAAAGFTLAIQQSDSLLGAMFALILGSMIFLGGSVILGIAPAVVLGLVLIRLNLTRIWHFALAGVAAALIASIPIQILAAGDELVYVLPCVSGGACAGVAAWWATKNDLAKRKQA